MRPPPSAMANRFRLTDAMWAVIQPCLPEHPPSPKGGRPRVDERACMDAIFFVLRTGCQWNALNATGLCPSSTAHDRFQAWRRAGVFERLWDAGLAEYDGLKGIGWSFLSMDGSMTKAPLGGGKNRPQPHRPRQIRRQAQRADGQAWRATDRRDRRGQRARRGPGRTDAGVAG